MKRKRYTDEQIINHLREADVVLAQGETVAGVCRRIGVSEHSYYRWRKEYGGLKVEQARRFKELKHENARLKRAVLSVEVAAFCQAQFPLRARSGCSACLGEGLQRPVCHERTNG